MPRHLCLAAAFLAGMAASAAARTDPVIQEIVAAVSQTRLTADVQNLEAFQTRHTYTQGNTDAGNWLYTYFQGLGIEAERHVFTFSGHTEENIIGRIRGTTTPDEIVILSGHFDSISENPYVLAPGADDNASAIAATLEAAFLLRNYRFDRTIEFVCFNGEEQGRKGSYALASDYVAAGKHVTAVINCDMLAYWPTAWQRDLDIAYEPVSLWLADRILADCQQYVGIPIAKHPTAGCQDDHYSFTMLGMSGVTAMDCWNAHNGGGESTPHYHRTTDTIGTLNLPCFTQAVQVVIAATADVAGPLGTTGAGSGGETSGPIRLVTAPNPMSAEGTITLSAPPGGTARLRILDLAGRVVRSFPEARIPAGARTYSWDRTDDTGGRVPGGTYWIAVTTAQGTEAAKIVVLE